MWTAAALAVILLLVGSVPSNHAPDACYQPPYKSFVVRVCCERTFVAHIAEYHLNFRVPFNVFEDIKVGDLTPYAFPGQRTLSSLPVQNGGVYEDRVRFEGPAGANHCHRRIFLLSVGVIGLADAEATLLRGGSTEILPLHLHDEIRVSALFRHRYLRLIASNPGALANPRLPEQFVALQHRFVGGLRAPARGSGCGPGSRESARHNLGLLVVDPDLNSGETSQRQGGSGAKGGRSRFDRFGWLPSVCTAAACLGAATAGPLTASGLIYWRCCPWRGVGMILLGWGLPLAGLIGVPSRLLWLAARRS